MIRGHVCQDQPVDELRCCRFDGQHLKFPPGVTVESRYSTFLCRGDSVTTQDQVNELLDTWEDVCASGASLSLDEYVAQKLQSINPVVIKAFRQRVLELAAIDRRLEQVVGVSAGCDLPLHPSTPAAHSTSNGNLCFTMGDLPPNPVTPSVHVSLSPIQPGIEPIPGYTLVSRLGSGGFGEVWKAESPGGFHVALKFVQLRGRVGEVEARSLDVIKDVRHPNLLSVFGTWRMGDWLIIATELADRTLLDRLHEAQKEGHEGIPRNELFKYMAEAAQGIDALNDPGKSGRKRIQHRDIKPQNLLLSGGSVKVGDFGLARLIQHDVTGHTGSLTFAYAAPECFDGTTSNQSDQYSLAITYCHLRGGRLPFDGTPVAIMDGHRKQPPDLSMISAEERPAVAKALAKLPKDRWGSCAAFLRALIAASKRKGSDTPVGEQLGDASTGLFQGFGVLYLTVLAAFLITAAVGTYLLSGKPGVPDPKVASGSSAVPGPLGVSINSPVSPPEPPATVEPQEANQDADGWQPLFNGKSIEGWKGDTHVMAIENGILVNDGKGGIVSPPGDFGDVEIEIEFRLQNGGNSGLGICYAGIGDPAEMGLEIQMLDDKGNPGFGDTEKCGAIWKLAAPNSGHFRLWPEWNRFRVTTLQDEIKVELNGVLITDTTRTIMKRGNPNHTGLLRTSGQVCLSPHTGRSEYRTFRIRTVNPQPLAPTLPTGAQDHPVQPVVVQPAVHPSQLVQTVRGADSTSPFEGQEAGEAKVLSPGITFHWCSAGHFTMGTPGATDDESPVEVRLSQGFWLGETEVTQGQWEILMNSAPWRGKVYVKDDSSCAATYTIHQDAVEYCEHFTLQERAANRLPKGWKYCLPTEAQWEYACRAGTATKYSFGDDESKLGVYAWFLDNSRGISDSLTPRVGLKLPNPWGFRDMHGNVHEWCADWYDSKLAGGQDPLGTKPGSLRVHRGGGWFNDPFGCRSARRVGWSPKRKNSELGFRVAAVPAM